MAAKRSRVACKCGNKRRFATQKIALGEIMRLRRARNESFDTLQPYRCCFCGAYHFGNAPRLARLLARKAVSDAANLRRESKQRKWNGAFLLRDCARAEDLALLRALQMTLPKRKSPGRIADLRHP